MPIKFYAAIPVSYITADLPPGRYLVSAKGLWTGGNFGNFWKLSKLTPDHEILIDSGGFSFTEYPPDYIEWYYEMSRSPVNRELADINPTTKGANITGFFQIDRLYDVEFTETNRTPHTIPIIRAEHWDVVSQINHLPKDCQFIGIGGLKKLHPTKAAQKALYIMETAKVYRDIKRFHLLGAGLKLISKIKFTLSCEFFTDMEISCDSGSWNCRFGSKINEFDAVMKANNWTQRETALRHYLPRYREEVES